MLKNFIVRLLVYPFCVVILVVSYKMVFDSSINSDSFYSAKGKFYGVFGIGIALVYLVSDIIYQIKKAFFDKKD